MNKKYMKFIYDLDCSCGSDCIRQRSWPFLHYCLINEPSCYRTDAAERSVYSQKSVEACPEKNPRKYYGTIFQMIINIDESIKLF